MTTSVDPNRKLLLLACAGAELLVAAALLALLAS